MARKYGEERGNSIFTKAMNRARNTFVFEHHHVEMPKRHKERLKKAEKSRFWQNRRGKGLLLAIIILMAAGVPAMIYRDSLGAAIFEPEQTTNRVEIPQPSPTPTPVTDSGGDLSDNPGTSAEPATDTGGDIADEPEDDNETYVSTSGGRSSSGGSTPRSYDSPTTTPAVLNNVTEGNANLFIFDQTDDYGGNYPIYEGDLATFSAEYKNITNSSNIYSITDGTCYITIDSLNVNTFPMAYSSGHETYRFTINATEYGNFDWSVTCSANDYNLLTAEDTVLIFSRSSLNNVFISPQGEFNFYMSDIEVFPENSTFSFNTKLQIRNGTQVLIEFDALFETADVNLSGLVIDFNSTNIAVDFSNVPTAHVGSGRIIYLPDEGTGAYFCPGVTSLSQVNPDCANVIEFSHAEIVAVTSKSGVTASTDGTYYKLEYVE